MQELRMVSRKSSLYSGHLFFDFAIDLAQIEVVCCSEHARTIYLRQDELPFVTDARNTAP
jgi:hypothetical protein